MTVWNTRRPRRNSPPAGSALSTSQTKDATFLWSAGLPLSSLVTQARGTQDGTWTATMGPGGLGCRSASGGTPHVEFAPSAAATSTDYTVFAYVNDDSGNGAIRSPIDGDNQTSARVFQLRFKADDGVEFITFDTSGNPYSATGAAISFAPRVGLLVGRIVGNSVSVWWQGKQYATASASNTPKAVSAADLIVIGCSKASSLTLTQGFPGQVLLAGHVNRGWTDSEIIANSENPWRLFAPIPRTLWGQAGTDSTAPTLSSPTGTGGTLTGSGTVTTNEANGTLFYKADASSTATDPGSGAEAGAGWSSQSVSATGVQTVTSFGALTDGTRYAHYLHVDAAGNRSTVSNSAGFTVAAGSGGASRARIYYEHLIGRA